MKTTLFEKHFLPNGFTIEAFDNVNGYLAMSNWLGDMTAKEFSQKVEDYTTEHNDEIKALIDEMIEEVRPPCKHRGCYNHITHPCEGCGRIQGKLPKEAIEALTGLKEKLGDKK